MEQLGVSSVPFQELRMMLIGISNIRILAKLFVWTVIGIYKIFASILNPAGGGFDPKMVVSLTGQFTLATGTFADTLCKRDRGRYAISAHLFHGILCILLDIFLIL